MTQVQANAGHVNGANGNGNKGIVRSKAEGLKSLLEQLAPNMRAVLPKHLTAERLIKVVMTAAIKSPNLYECTRESIMQSVMLSAQLGLDCGGALGSAYLVPYGKVCQLIIGYRGMIDLARRSGQIASISARAVFDGDTFQFEYGLADTLRHVPMVDPDPKKLTHVYAVAHFKDGGHHIEVMTKREVDSIRQRSKASGSGPWVTDYVEMAKKTVIRRAFKYLPMSVEMQTTLSEMQETAVGKDVIGDIIDTTASEATEPTSEQQASTLVDALNKAKQENGGTDNGSAGAGAERSEPQDASPADPAINQQRPNTGTVDRTPPGGRKPRGSQHSAGDLLSGNVDKGHTPITADDVEDALGGGGGNG